MDVGNSFGVDDTKHLVVEALEGRESLMQEVVDCLVLGGINPELQHACAPRNSFTNVGKEYVEAEQYVISAGTFGISNIILPSSMHMFSADNQNKVDAKKEVQKYCTETYPRVQEVVLGFKGHLGFKEIHVEAWIFQQSDS